MTIPVVFTDTGDPAAGGDLVAARGIEPGVGAAGEVRKASRVDAAGREGVDAADEASAVLAGAGASASDAGESGVGAARHPEGGEVQPGAGANATAPGGKKNAGHAPGGTKGQAAGQERQFSPEVSVARAGEVRDTGRGETASGAARPETRVASAGEIARQIVDRARVMRFPDRTEVEIRLKPESLGRVLLKVSMEGGRLSARFVVNRPEVRAAIETGMDDLQRGLAEQGLEVKDLAVSINDFGYANDPRHAREGEAYSQPRGGSTREAPTMGGVETPRSAAAVTWSTGGSAIDLIA